MAITNLTNTEWKLKSSISLPTISISLNITSNSNNFTSITKDGDNLKFDAIVVYNNEDGWVSDEYRKIKITGGPDVSSLNVIAWITGNASDISENEWLNRRGLDTFWALCKRTFGKVDDVIVDGASVVTDKIAYLNDLASKTWVEAQDYVKRNADDLINYYKKTETYNQTEVDNLLANALLDYYTKTETYNQDEIDAMLVNALLDYYTKSETYNKTEVDNKLVNALLDYYKKTETYNKTEVDNLLVDALLDYYTKSETYNQTEIDAMFVNALLDYYKKSETYNQEEVNELIGDMEGVSIEVVTTLPSTGASNIIYLLPIPGTSNLYEQYIWFNSHWISIGSTDIDLSQYLKIEDAEDTYQKLSNLVTLIASSSDNTHYPSAKAVYDFVNTNYQDIADFVTSISASSDNNHYPSAKAVYDFVNGVYQTLGNLVTNIASSSDDTHYPSAKAVYDFVDDAYQKISNLVNTISATSDNTHYPSAKAVYDFVNGAYQKISNLVTTISSSSDNTHYPGAKAVYDFVDGAYQKLSNLTTSITSSSDNTHYPGAKAVYDLIQDSIDGFATEDWANNKFQLLSNLVTHLSASSTDAQYPSAKAVYKYGQEIIDLITEMSCPFKVGGIYITVDSANPSTLWVGTSWERIAYGQTLVGVDESDADFDAPEKVFGEKEHQLSKDEMPIHTHIQNKHRHTMKYEAKKTASGTSYYRPVSISATVGEEFISTYTTATNQNAGGDLPHNNVQPSFTVYMWKRIA